MAKFLMCKPDGYGIFYSINPWMQPEYWEMTDHYLAVRQWNTLKDKLEELGHEVVVIDQAAGSPDMVFVANAGVVHNNQVTLSCMKNEERKGETKEFARFFKEHFKVLNYNSQVQEGAGDCLFDPLRNFFWNGYGQRSVEGASWYTEEVFTKGVVNLELTDPFFYHLDTCFCPLTHGEVVYYPPAFSSFAREIIEKRIPRKRRIDLYSAEADAFCANMICVDDDIIMPDWHGDLPNELKEKHGYNVHMLDMSAFIAAGGACKCLVLRLDQ
jgi:N-dimethylarginine dimethylaminohydrolase